MGLRGLFCSGWSVKVGWCIFRLLGMWVCFDCVDLVVLFIVVICFDC